MLKKRIVNGLLIGIAAIIRAFLSLRYRVETHGLEALTPDRLRKKGGILFLPNHPAEIDPVILQTLLWKQFHLRPLIVEHFYNLKGFKWLMQLIDAMPLPTMDVLANQRRAKKVKKQLDHIADAVKNRNNFLVYPSGRLKATGAEIVGGASFVHDLLQVAPDVNVVLIRTTGLWGSQFSRALTGSVPDFLEVLKKGALIVLKNGIFFAPRRRVMIELEQVSHDFPMQGNRLELNRALESWYNHYPVEAVEPIKLVSYAFWKEDLPKVVCVNRQQDVDSAQIKVVSPQIQGEVYQELSRLSQHPLSELTTNMHLSQDLGMDSLDIAQVYIFLDDRYKVIDLVPGDLLSVQDVLQAAVGAKKKRSDLEAVEETAFVWPQELNRPSPKAMDTRLLQEAFLLNCDRMGSSIACVDAMSGGVSYSYLKMIILMLAHKISKMKGESIGVMLPSSVGAYCVILAVLLAKKTPVMINWTSGKKALEYAIEMTQITSVITSSRFLDRLGDEDLGKIEEMCLFLEDIKSSFSCKDKVYGMWNRYLKAATLIKKFQLSKIRDTDPAVILFTSGTESLPKGVPLSHQNLLQNQGAALSCVNIQADAILYGVLPPFHSFGFSVTGLLPLLTGLKACYAPDPTDGHGMARDIARWKPTIFCCAPSFIRSVFHVADPKQLQSLKLVIAGAEKTPQNLFDYVHTHLPNAEILEGYGITECSPIVSLDRPGLGHQGVGHPLPGVEIMIFNGMTMQPVAAGEEGEIGIAGSNVFGGYLGNSRDPFLSVAGRKWYLSGDLGKIGPQGHLILLGRLKRFIKIGGEMVSLGGLEEELLRLAQEKKWVSGGQDGPLLAVSVREKESDKPQIVLFTTFSVSKEDVNLALKNGGYGRLVKVAEVKQVNEIPLMGTGKTHYRLLDETLQR